MVGAIIGFSCKQEVGDGIPTKTPVTFTLDLARLSFGCPVLALLWWFCLDVGPMVVLLFFELCCVVAPVVDESFSHRLVTVFFTDS